MNKEIRAKDLFVIGFALFAMFFGAGNLIFPPYLGLISGHQWWVGFLGFTITDAGLGLLAIIALSKYDGNLNALASRINKTFAIIISTAIILCIGPFLATPRTAATTYEVGILPIFGESVNRYLFSVIFFIVVFLLSIRSSKVVDIIGTFLTPSLLICMIILIIKGIISPIGKISETSMIDNVLQRGITDGYQTMDALAGCMFALVVINAVKTRNYSSQKTEIKATILSGIIAAVFLALIYGGLLYLGAQTSTLGIYDVSTDKTSLLVDITNTTLGGVGVYILGIITALACLTTAIGLISATGNFFHDLSKGKISYEAVVIICSIVSCIISMLGVNQIINISAPILEVLYPCTMTIVLLGLFNEKIKDDIVFKIPSLVSLIFGFLFVLQEKELLGKFGQTLESFPLQQFGLGWVFPMLIGLLVSIIIAKSKEL
ncbi:MULTISPECIES: branched-chain amino acid transport system II carrier protein [Peptoniphilus]|jgi:branched-chain amino acid transport system II carrier protein|uniref:branched-chain amino acid transport system II carrier protein n=2 Tax=Peptoniphilaceae TaxID=1570339 RepID=UPI000288984E|nr:MULTISPECIES: branched-chain amino acid transport system II carrier protein [Peptoniphilus]MBS6610097.1 branched-chain amino acid transport system II carrier protein [Peptoniphilus harei]MDU1043413.1 branched-chain amino acid transport system II carrier protein [Peptoniphilus rhinitidis]MDU1954129.1 branched-chain amino acid transport system II carrier protein [Peptoniphilus lacydonensis]MDU2110123.1 branched-chain amino acid transport system II carrier protein [Peptoniphilus lacydonensis]M